MRGKRMRRLRTQLSGRGFRAVAAARLLPLGHFTVVNLLAGGMRVPVGKFLLANVVGLLPGILALSFFADRLWQLVRAPNPLDLVLVVVSAALLAYVLLWLKRALERAPSERRRFSQAHPGAGG
jgi:phospholipase D1/2